MRLDLDLERGVVLVTLSRRNILALLGKLGQPGSARTLLGRYAYTDGELLDDVLLLVRAEPDADHYDGREGPGAMHPLTEAFIGAHDGRNGGAPSDGDWTGEHEGRPERRHGDEEAELGPDPERPR